MVNPTAEQSPTRKSGRVTVWAAGKFNWINCPSIINVMTEYLLNPEQPYWVQFLTDDLLRFKTWMSYCPDNDFGTMWVEGGRKLPPFCLDIILHPCQVWSAPQSCKRSTPTNEQVLLSICHPPKSLCTFLAPHSFQQLRAGRSVCMNLRVDGIWIHVASVIKKVAGWYWPCHGVFTLWHLLKGNGNKTEWERQKMQSECQNAMGQDGPYCIVIKWTSPNLQLCLFLINLHVFPALVEFCHSR